MATLKAHKNQLQPTVLQYSVIQINTTETILLIQMLNSIKTANNALPPSAARFVGKNLKKLMSLNDKSVANESVLESKYGEKDAKGNDLYWDGKKDEIKKIGEGEEAVEELVHGTKAWLDKKKNILYDTVTGAELPANKLPEMRLYIPTEEKLEEYLDELKKIREEKHECHIVKISHDYLEENRIVIPTKMLNPQTNKPFSLELDSFFEFLVIDGNLTPENLN